MLVLFFLLLLSHPDFEFVEDIGAFDGVGVQFNDIEKYVFHVHTLLEPGEDLRLQNQLLPVYLILTFVDVLIQRLLDGMTEQLGNGHFVLEGDPRHLYTELYDDVLQVRLAHHLQSVAQPHLRQVGVGHVF